MNINKHYNIDFEKSVLASLMSIENSFDIVSDIITADDFMAGRHKLVFNAIKHLHQSNDICDLITVIDRLTLTGDMKSAGGDKYLTEILVTSPATLTMLVSYCEKIKEYSQVRVSLEALTLARAHLDNRVSKDSLESQINDVVTQLSSIVDGNQKEVGIQSIGELLSDFFDTLGNAAKNGVPPFIKTGFFDLDSKAGVMPADLVVIGARPSMGKTTFVMSLLSGIIESTQKTGVFFSLEMPKDAVVKKFMSARSGVDFEKVRGGQHVDEDDWAALMKVATENSSNDSLLQIDDRYALTYSQMRTTLTRLKARGHDLGCVVIDYLTIMGGLEDSNNKANDIGVITRNLKGLAKEFNVPIFLLSQLNRDVEKRPNKRPMNSDLRDSGAIEQDADIIMFIYRDEVYNDKTEDKGIAEIGITKNRNGEIGTVRLGFEGQYSRFSNFMLG
ncbi:replicative DNA helicase [Psychrobacter sp.]|uniref:replicative DNA helicase n=1 Tax=unclassified Psychrobacter TaxID=196806 RepID=UPI003F957108